MKPISLILLALAVGVATALVASPVHLTVNPATATNSTVTNSSTTETPLLTATNATNTTTSIPVLGNSSMAQNATCTAAMVHIELSLFFYQKVKALANATGELKLVNYTLNEAYNLTKEANETLSKGLCFTALKEAIEAIHLEQRAWSESIRTFSMERHINLTEFVKAEAELRMLNRTLTVAYRIANETGNSTLLNEIKSLINQTKLANKLLREGNYTGALKTLSGIKQSIAQLTRQVHEEAKKWVEEYKALHGHGKGNGHGKPSGGEGKGNGSGNSNHGHGKGHS
ncbi:hypothetical protein [Caldivirga maquilingensis]|uniref:Uncharacterized protein n=1 Tax=Caldivirga maquilingensis (strain ATCC 700844 / DSM 13496 / JCM 10307 / IC-167) TaxID=397948 RepID=A8MCH0_CALMQ|nr:hypothetical protein [Caldivirga maquilingensis]ABW01476.1 hypothetical protein Cmaq_0636 [Caldivirga maquilingensis IC-167]